MSPPRVSVVIPCRNEAPHIRALLRAIEGQDFPVDEVVVVDAASTDGTLDEVGRFRAGGARLSVWVVEGPVGAIPVSLNRGIARATGDVIVRFDAHSLPRADYVRRAVELLADQAVGVVGGIWNIAPGGSTPVARAIAIAVSHPLAAGDAAYRIAGPGSGVRDVESVPFGCYRRVVWERLGGYTEDLQVAEDYEFNHRVSDLGLRVVLDTSMVSTYFARRTWRALARQYFRYGWWKGEVFRRFPRAWRVRTLVPAAFVLGVLGLAAGAMVVDVLETVLAIVLGAYAVTVGVGALQATSRGALRLGPLVAASFAIVHVVQGAGLLANLAARTLTRRLA